MSLFSGNSVKAAILVDLAVGPGGNRKEIEALKASRILESARIFTAADFTGLAESDIEDIWGADAYMAVVNEAFDLKGGLTSGELATVHEASPRVLKRVEAWFRVQPKAPEFDHYRPAEFLILSPKFIADHAPLFSDALSRFESFFKKVNSLL